MQTRIVVQREDFSLADEYARLAGDASVGAIVAFVGRVRDLAGVAALELEHYPGMAEKQLSAIVAQAGERWPISAATVIHRVGRMEAAEQIVLVLTASAHRRAAYEANEFIMDFLKTDAPFWKREFTSAGANWVEARDEGAQARWGQDAN
jgi:molybdopterin synthase catalytic subunit